MSTSKTGPHDATPSTAAAVARTIRKRYLVERLFLLAAYAMTGIALLALFALIGALAYVGLPAIDWSFLTSFPSRFPEQAGILSAWVGSLLVILLTVLISIPLGVSSAVYLEEFAPRNWFTRVIEINISNLAAVPSIIFGLLALGLFVYFFGFGRSVLTAGLTLALLILPIIIVTSREAIRAVPSDMRVAALALGATRLQVVQHHVLPYAAPGIMTGIIIGISRALGETAPLITIGALTFIAFLPQPPLTGEFPFIDLSWVFDPFTVLPIQMFNWVSRPGDAFVQNAAAAGFVLLLVTLVLNGFAIYFRARLRRRITW